MTNESAADDEINKLLKQTIMPIGREECGKDLFIQCETFQIIIIRISILVTKKMINICCYNY